MRSEISILYLLQHIPNILTVVLTVTEPTTVTFIGGFGMVAVYNNMFPVVYFTRLHREFRTAKFRYDIKPCDIPSFRTKAYSTQKKIRETLRRGYDNNSCMRTTVETDETFTPFRIYFSLSLSLSVSLTHALLFFVHADHCSHRIFRLLPIIHVDSHGIRV